MDLGLNIQQSKMVSFKYRKNTKRLHSEWIGYYFDKEIKSLSYVNFKGKIKKKKRLIKTSLLALTTPNYVPPLQEEVQHLKSTYVGRHYAEPFLCVISFYRHLKK